MEWLSFSFAVACVVLTLVGYVKWVQSSPENRIASGVGSGHAAVGVLCLMGALVVSLFVAETNKFHESAVAVGVTVYCLVRKIQWYKRYATAEQK